MKLYKQNTRSVAVGGVVYVADGDGVIDVPDGRVTGAVFAAGFVDAKARLAELARAQVVSTGATGAIGATFNAASVLADATDADNPADASLVPIGVLADTPIDRQSAAELRWAIVDNPADATLAPAAGTAAKKKNGSK